MRVRPRSLDAFPHGCAHDAERPSRRIAICQQACGKLRQAKNLRVGFAHYKGIIKTRYKHCHLGIFPFLDSQRGMCYYPNVKSVTAHYLNVKCFNIKILLLGGTYG